MSIVCSTMSLNLFNVELPEEDADVPICMICHAGLPSAQHYALPECGHKYHTHCIVTWFRHRPSTEDLGGAGGRCPYCGNRGVNNIADKMGGHCVESWRRGRRLCAAEKYRYTMILREGKKANAPPVLKNLIKKVAAQSLALDQATEAHRTYKASLKTEHVDYADAKKTLNNLRRTLWLKGRSLAGARRIISEFPIVPIIIPTPVDLN
jgi:hypothetical protein